MEVGNLVAPTKESGFILHCSTAMYEKAVVISTEPFLLTSEDSNMLWSKTIKKRDFKKIGEVDKKTLNKCLRRL
jgi:hypothetical protein